MNTPQYRYEQQQKKKAAEAINVAQIVKVTAYDGAKQTVDVQPISKGSSREPYQSQPPILGVPLVSTGAEASPRRSPTRPETSASWSSATMTSTTP